MSYHIISYRIVSYRIVSYRIVSYRIVSYRIVSHLIRSYRIISYPSYHISFRAHRVQPISLSARYKQSSARFTASARPSISSTNRSAPSVRGIAETRFESRPYMTQPYNPTPSPFRGMTETRIDSSPYANTTQFDQRSTNSGNRSQGIRTRDSSGRSLQGGREFQNQNNKIESLISRHDSSHMIIPNQAFLMVPYAGNKKLSL